MKRLSILGSTGSIGKNALDIVRMYPDRFRVTAMTAANNTECLAKQIEEFKPEIVAVIDKERALDLSRLLKGNHGPEILFGEEGYIEAASYKNSDMVLLAMVGSAGLKPALAAIESKKQIALANKETLVMAGDIVMARALENGVSIMPVDSEHSAIFQCLQGNRQKDIKKLILTASGGPFRTKPLHDFKDISLEDALHHPNWTMGKKITIDSATLMNKGLEVIEALHLFHVLPEEIEVVIHPESIVHSMVGFKDGTVMAQMGRPDMKGAICYALSSPERLDLKLDFPDFTGLGALTFEKPDTKKFPSLLFAFEACKEKGTLPAVLNAANEIAVNAFLEKRISFQDIFRHISKTMESHTRIDNPDLFSIIEADCWAREKLESLI
ncbi:MAG: 1-deoxy-D-xylulose-5-phosphate reductoisomerase [Desulfobacterales bacterium RIFOXYA12_FULL_46_15]|nr:MAG: 1-deoxy-D-xylulose-5-phosphate reductoisomerase [Desulfobacterales bacterium RIFOXYA12_FULL_46_15]